MQMTEIKAYAKINLDLKILGRLQNGYHKIRSTFQAVSLYDTINILKIKRGFQLTGSLICLPEENTITKAKKSLEKLIQYPLPCIIDLQKNIPVSAGLGGGSSDAATALHGLNKLFGIGLNLNELAKIGLEIGSDVPFFLYNKGTALVTGRGETVKAAKRRLSEFYVIARPHKRISTAESYKRYDETSKSFFELAQEKCPATGLIHEYFSSYSREYGMSGTGPSMFAGFESYENALKASNGLDRKLRGFDGDIFICKPSSRTYEFAGN